MLWLVGTIPRSTQVLSCIEEQFLMKTFLRLDIWRHELRILGPVLFVIPIGLALFFVALTVMMFAGNVPRSFIASLLIAGIEACLPLAAGILLATVAMHD